MLNTSSHSYANVGQRFEMALTHTEFLVVYNLLLESQILEHKYNCFVNQSCGNAEDAQLAQKIYVSARRCQHQMLDSVKMHRHRFVSERSASKAQNRRCHGCHCTVSVIKTERPIDQGETLSRDVTVVN